MILRFHDSQCAIAPLGVHDSSRDAIQFLQLDAVLALVKTDQYTFHSGAWFLATKCDATVRDGLKKGTDDGFDAYVTRCVGTANTPERIAYWKRAKEAFGIA